jgi:hypothetical protein
VSHHEDELLKILYGMFRKYVEVVISLCGLMSLHHGLRNFHSCKEYDLVIPLKKGNIELPLPKY